MGRGRRKRKTGLRIREGRESHGMGLTPQQKLSLLSLQPVGGRKESEEQSSQCQINNNTKLQSVRKGFMMNYSTHPIFAC